jgi:excisionase family DNA binding protein
MSANSTDTTQILGLLQQSIEAAMRKSTIPREAFSREEVAEILGVSVRTIEGLVDTQQMRAVRIGRHLRIDRKEIDRFLGRETR